MKKSKLFLVLVLVAITFSPMAYGIVLQVKYSKTPTISQAEQAIQDPEQNSLPKKFDIPMTFYSQAPYGNWKQPWQDACEEASLLLVANFYNEYNWTRAQFKDKILELVKWENETFGDYKDNNTQQITQALKDLFGLSSVIHENPTFEDIQKILVQNHPIIIPLAGKKIGNPFYKNGGPNYHVIVIKGYKANQKVITEDVGTSFGKDYVYSWKTLENANHDYAIPITKGKKVIIEVL